MKIIGIDPDLDESGIAIYSKSTNVLVSKKIKFFELYEWLQLNKNDIKIVKIEAGWLNKKANFRATKNRNISDTISKRVGENHAIGKKIAEMCDILNINYKLSKPLLKKWKGKDGKITHIELIKLLQHLNISINNRTNQDVRDSILICLF